MEERVILNLETYNKMVDRSSYLENKIVNLQETIDELTTKCSDLNNENHDLKQFAIEKTFYGYSLYFDRYSLEELLDENDYKLKSYLETMPKRFNIDLNDVKEYIKKMYQEYKEGKE